MTDISNVQVYAENSTSKNLLVIQQLLNQARALAHDNGEDMLCYLLDMANLETSDIIAADRRNSAIDN